MHGLKSVLVVNQSYPTTPITGKCSRGGRKERTKSSASRRVGKHKRILKIETSNFEEEKEAFD